MAAVLWCVSPVHAQLVSGSCAVTAVPSQARVEGVTERMGDILLQCSGSSPGAVLAGNFSVYPPVNVTNRVDSGSRTTDAVLSVDYGGGFVPSGIAGVVTNQIIAFNGISFTVPPSGNLSIRISNLRGNASQAGTEPIRAQIVFSSTASIQVNQSLLVVANPQTSVYATLYSSGIACTGSPVPATLSLSNLFQAGTAFASTRLTEGFAAAFQPRSGTDDNGTRFLVKYSGFPSNAHLYVPDLVAGSSALVPTAGGDLGAQQNVGQYAPGSSTLLLARVTGADANGAGGNPAQLPAGSNPVALNSVSEVPLSGGAGYAVYEVADANPDLQETVQFPTFIALSIVTAPAVAAESVSLAPVSTTPAASVSAPVPRFVAVDPPSDCTLLGDCGAAYFPRLNVPAPPIQLTAVAGGEMTSLAGYIPIQNAGGGILNWTATVVYGSGSGWLSLSSTSGQSYGSIMVVANAKSLAAGAYQAKIVIDAGPLAGNATVPVTLVVQAAPTPTPPPTPAVTVSKVVNAATFQATPLVAGSLGTLMGSHLSGKIVAVTLDGLPASLLYTSDTQINFQVPAGLGAKTSATLVVTADGSSSAPVVVALAPAWPSIFANGVLNQDSTVNSAANGAAAGTILQIFATGVPASATVSAQIADRTDLIPLYAGDAPTLLGVQQVNVAVPGDLASSATQVILCASTGGQSYCSAAVPLTVR